MKVERKAMNDADTMCDVRMADMVTVLVVMTTILGLVYCDLV